jgi:hypothetical protein
MQETSIVEKTDNTVDDGEFVLGDVKPDVKAIDELAPDFFARVGSDVGVWLEQFLA